MHTATPSHYLMYNVQMQRITQCARSNDATEISCCIPFNDPRGKFTEWWMNLYRAYTRAHTFEILFFFSKLLHLYLKHWKKIALPAQKKIYRRYSFHLCYFWFVVVALIWSVKSLLDSFVCLQTVCAGCRISTVKLFTWVLQQEKRKLLLPFYNSLLLSSSSLFAYQQTTNLPHTHIYGGRNTTLGKLTACECVCVSLAQCMHKNTNKCRWARRCDSRAPSNSQPRKVADNSQNISIINTRHISPCIRGPKWERWLRIL